MEGVGQHIVAGLISSPGIMKLLFDQEGVPLFQMEKPTFAIQESGTSVDPQRFCLLQVSTTWTDD